MTSERDISSGSGRFRLLRVDSETLAMDEESVLDVIDWTEPTPLPFAPASVLGVVSVQGRMFTVLDLRLLLDLDPSRQSGGFIVALHGDEQLALAVDETKEEVETKARQSTTQTGTNLIRGTIKIHDKEVSLLALDRLFAYVIRGRERRQRRL